MDIELTPFATTLKDVNLRAKFEFVGSPLGFSLSDTPIELDLASILHSSKILYLNEMVRLDRDEKNKTIPKDIYVSEVDKNSKAIQDLLEIGNQKKIYISCAIINEIENNFPINIGLDLIGPKTFSDTPPDSSNSSSSNSSMSTNQKDAPKKSTFSVILNENAKTEENLVLVNPDIPPHSPTFIKSFCLCKEKRDLVRGLNLEILEIPRASQSTPQDDDDLEGLNIGSLSLNDNPDLMEKHVAISTRKVRNDHALLDEILKLPRNDYVNEFYAEKKEPENKESGIRKDDNIYIDHEIFESFLDGKWKYVNSFDRTLLELKDIKLRIHNALKKFDDSTLWKSPQFVPDDDYNTYRLKFSVQFFIYIVNDHSTTAHYSST